MSWNRHRRPQDGGSAPATPGFIAIAPEWLIAYGAADAAPVIPAAESTLGSHPCAALSSAQVLPEWINHNPAVHAFASGSANPLTSCLSPGVHFNDVLCIISSSYHSITFPMTECRRRASAWSARYVDSRSYHAASLSLGRS